MHRRGLASGTIRCSVVPTRMHLLIVMLLLVAHPESRSFSIGDNTTALYHFGVLVDPISEAAQKWTSLFEVCCLNQCSRFRLSDRFSSGCKRYRVFISSSMSTRRGSARYDLVFLGYALTAECRSSAPSEAFLPLQPLTPIDI